MAVTKEQMEKLTRLKKSLEEYRAVFQSQWNDIIQYLAASYCIRDDRQAGLAACAKLPQHTGDHRRRQQQHHG